MKNKIILFLLLLFPALYAHSQITVSGTVLDGSMDNAPLFGATVQIKGTTTGTTTDFDGKYTLNVSSDDDTLVFSFIGLMTVEEQVAARTTIDVILRADEEVLEEVVVTAFGIEKEKKELGYSFQEVSGEEMAQGGQPNIANSLQGKIAGVQVKQTSGMPGASSLVTIRGSRSLLGNNQPLYVIDGMPIESNASLSAGISGGTDGSSRSIDINPDDIESINVLKGPTAAALYGLKASNGVVVITTKNGSAAKKAKKAFLVTYNTAYSWDKVTRLPELQSKYAQGNNGEFYPWSSSSWGPEIATMQKYPVQDDPFNYDYENASDELRVIEPKVYDNMQNFFRTGHSFKNSIDVSSAGNFGNYSVGLGAIKQDGMIETTGMNRYTAKFSGLFNLSDKLKIGASSNFSDVQIDKIPGGNNMSNPLFTVYSAPRTYDLTNTAFENENNPYIQHHYRTQMDNPYWALKYNKFYENTKRFFGNMSLNYEPLDWINITGRVGVDNFTTIGKEFLELGSAQTGGRAYPEFLPEGAVFGYFAEPKGGEINNYMYQQNNFNSNLIATFSKKVIEDLRIDLILGAELNDQKSYFLSEQGNSLSVGSFQNISSNTAEQFTSEYKIWQRNVGMFSNLTASYKGYLILQATLRNDKVSSMPRGKRSFLYPSVSMSWVFSEMSMLENAKFLTYGKIRASYAQVGQAGSPYSTRNTYTPGGVSNGYLVYGIQFPFNELTAFTANNILMSDGLRPQNTASTEAGFDLRFFNSRIGLEYTFYYTNAKDQIFSVPIPNSTGYSAELGNAGQITTIGHEAIFILKPVDKKNFDWEITTNFSIYENELKKLTEGIERIQVSESFSTIGVFAYEGMSYPVITGTSYLRDENGNLVLDSRQMLNGVENPTYGMPIQHIDTVLATVAPDFMVGITNTFTVFKSLSLSFNIDWKQGGHMYSGLNMLMRYYGMDKITENRDEETVIEGVKGYIDDEGKLVTEGKNDISITKNEEYWSILSDITEANVFETSYIRLREVIVSYNMPSKWFENTFITGVSANISGRNLFLWTTYPNFDPEASTSGGNGTGGFEYVSLPNAKSVLVGLKLTF